MRHYLSMDSRTEVEGFVVLSCHFLLVDDEPGHADLVRLMLQRHFEDKLTVADNAFEGIELAQQIQPDLIMVRLMLHGGIDGYEVCRRLKAIPAIKAVPVLLFAAKSPEFVYDQAKQCGAAGYLLQPYDPNDLYAARNALLNGESYYP